EGHPAGRELLDEALDFGSVAVRDRTVRSREDRDRRLAGPGPQRIDLAAVQVEKPRTGGRGIVLTGRDEGRGCEGDNGCRAPAGPSARQHPVVLDEARSRNPPAS